MTRIIRGRAANDVDYTNTQRTKRKAKEDLVAKPPQKKVKRKPQKSSHKNGAAKPSVEHDYTQSTPPPTPTNPQATLLGIPTELRLQIYGYVFDSTLIHVHRHEIDELDDTMWSPPRFTWTPCRGVNPNSNLLCANPKWSGLCKESDRCTFRPFAPKDPTGFAALAWTCKFIRQETQEFFLRNTTVSIHARDVRPWLDHLEKNAPTYIDLLTRITITGLDNFETHMNTALADIKKRVPNLEAVGFQGQVAKWVWYDQSAPCLVDPSNKWKQWRMVEWMKTNFNRDITVAMEGHMFAKPRRWWNSGPTKEKQASFRVIREAIIPVDGMTSGTGWEDKDVRVYAAGPDLVEPKRNAKWRKWWRGKHAQALL